MENNNEKVRRPRIARDTKPQSDERRSYGENRPQGENHSYGERRSFGSESGERRSYSDRKPSYGEHRSYGERPSSNYGDRKSSYGEHRSYSDRKPSYGDSSERRPYGEHRSYNNEGGERKPYSRPYNSENSERRPYGEHRSYGDRKPSFGGERRSYGDRGGFRKSYDRAAEEGINKMISDRPVVDADLVSDNDVVEIPVKDEMRLNKFIANSGICSRREADDYIQAGVVTVNGEVITELGSKVNIYKDDVRFNGERLKGEEKVYIVMNKPKGYVTTTSDPHAEKTVMELLKGCPSRVFAVGRLDKNTTGVLMFTNDGEIAEKLTHPSYDKKKIYQVTLDRDLSQEDFDKILSGVTLTDGEVSADDLQYIDAEDKRKLGIEIHTGKNRIVRRIFESLGYDVKALDRVYFAGLTKKGLKRGEWRVLTEGETNILKMGAYR